MFEITTAEIKWFYKGEIPEAVKTWFENLDGIFSEENKRADVYLSIPSTGSVGIKFREGRFEIKQKKKDLGLLEFPPNITGIAEMWKKWSFQSGDNEVSIEAETNREWIEVFKTRNLQKFIFGHTGKISGGFDNYKSDGCNVELTKVFANTFHSSDDSESSDESSVTWWTLGLETYGATGSLEKNLYTAYDYIFQSNFPWLLSKGNSYGYPEWLIKL